MYRKLILLSLMCFGASLKAYTYPKNKVASFKVSGGVAWTDYHRESSDYGNMHPDYDPFRYESDYSNLSLQGSINFGFSGEFFLRNRLALGFSYKRNTADFHYQSSHRRYWDGDSDYNSHSKVSQNEFGRRDIALYMKAYINRNVYIKSGLGYSTAMYNSNSFRSTVTNWPRSGATLPLAVGTEWNLGAFDFAIDWIGVNMSLERIAPSVGNDAENTPFHEVSVATIHLGVAV